MNKESKQHLIRSLEKGIRYDGRDLLDYREIEVKTGVSSTAEGSALVKMGDTEVLVGVKLQIEKPFPDNPDEGILMVGSELLPLSNRDFEAGPPSIDSIELARVIDRGIRESGTVDVKKLVIEKGEKVWGVMVDICPINATGNLFDASFLGVMAALKDVRFPALNEDGIVDYKKRTNKKLPLLKTPASVTVIKIGNYFIVDPIPDEEEALDSRLSVTVTEDDMICALQKGGDMPLKIDDIEKMLDIAIEKTKFLRKFLKWIENDFILYYFIFFNIIKLCS